MITSVGKILKLIDQIAPFETASTWDNSGLLIGSESKAVDRVLIALDATEAVIDEAIEEGFDLIVTHHPLIFSGIKRITLNDRLGKLIFKLIQNDIALIAAHTNLDRATAGINTFLAEAYHLTNVQPLIETGDDAEFGRVGLLEEPISMEAFVIQTKQIFKIEHLKVVDRSGGRLIRKVAISSGASADFIDAALAQHADAFVLGDLKYHEAQAVLDTSLSLLDVGHFESEWIYLDALKNLIKQRAEDKNYDIFIKVSDSEMPIFQTR